MNIHCLRKQILCNNITCYCALVEFTEAVLSLEGDLQAESTQRGVVDLKEPGQNTEELGSPTELWEWFLHEVGDDKRDDHSRLPHTGSELTAAGAGLALLAIGTAGIMLTRRRS